MVSKSNRTMLMLALLATALAAVGWWFGAQLRPIWWLTWLAPLPLLWLATRVRARWAALATFVAISIGGLPYWPYTHSYIGMPISASLFAIFAPAGIITLAILLYRRLAGQSRYLAAAFAFPALITAALFVNAMVSINGSWGELGYTQMDALPVIQLAALTGVSGVGFLVMLGPACAAILCNRSAPRAARLRTLLVGGGLIALALVFGAWRLYAAPAGTPVKIGLVSLQHPGGASLNSAAGQTLLRRYTSDVRRLAARGAQMVVLPETVWTTSKPDIPALDALAQHAGVILLASVNYHPPGKPKRDASLAFGSQGGTPTMYVKHHLMAGASYVPGRDYTMLAGMPRIGLTICKDMDFPAMGRSYAARDAQLLLVPAGDFGVDDWLHSRMAIMRGVESGFAIARAARYGRLTLSDDRGRVLAEANGTDQDAKLLGTLPLRHTQTLYARWGNWFGWLVVAALAGLLGLAWFGGKHKA